MGQQTTTLILGVLVCQSLGMYLNSTQNVEQQAQELIRQYDEQIRSSYNQIKEENFVSDSGFLEGVTKLEVFKEMCSRTAAIARYARNFPLNEIRDEVLKKQLTRLSNAGLKALGEDYFYNVVSTVDALVKMVESPTLCAYRSKEQCELSYINDVRRILSQSQDAHELQYYWEEWRNKMSPTARQFLKALVEQFNEAAQINGVSELSLWYEKYEDSNFLEDMEDVMKQLKPFYTEFHAYVRYVLNKKYGELVVSANGPIPHHLIEQILIQAWKKSSILEHPYPNRKLPNLKEKLDEYGLNARRIVEVSDDFFRSMGFQSLPNEFWMNFTKLKTKEESTGDCKADVFDFTPDVALKYCPKADYKKFLQLHGDMALLHYAVVKKDLPVAFFDSYGFEHAVSEAVILSASTPKHTRRIGLLRDYHYDEQLSMNRLFRLGLHTMFNIPMHFVHSKIMSEVLAGRIQFDNINKRYWELMEEHAGIEPPSDRSITNIDFPYKFYIEIENNYQTRKFSSEVLGYQFYRALCKISGSYVKGSPNQPLQNCDFFESHPAGEALKRMMALGSTKPWKDVLAELIEDEPDLNAAAMLEFYEPLRNWLEAQNNLNNVRLGWTHSTKSSTQ